MPEFLPKWPCPRPTRSCSGLPRLISWAQSSAINDVGQILVPSADPVTGANVGLLISGSTTTVIGAAPDTCGATDAIVFGLNARGWWSSELSEHPAGCSGSGITAALSCLIRRIRSISCRAASTTSATSWVFVVLTCREMADAKRERFWISSPATEWLPINSTPIPPSGRLASQSVGFTNPNDNGYLIFLRVASHSYSIMQNSTVIGTLSGSSPQNGPLMALNNRMQFISGQYLCSLAQ
jgi:hypothetical protein